MTKFVFIEGQSLAGYLSKYMEIHCLWHKTVEENDVFA